MFNNSGLMSAEKKFDRLTFLERDEYFENTRRQDSINQIGMFHDGMIRW